MPASMVIGIHGLKNKPAKDLLARWWAMSLQEGLQTQSRARVSARLRTGVLG